MNVSKAAANTLLIWEKNIKALSRTPEAVGLPAPHRNAEGVNLPHQVFLLDQVANGKVGGEKAHRWLGYAQGYLVADGAVTLTDCKYANVFA